MSRLEWVSGRIIHLIWETFGAAAGSHLVGVQVGKGVTVNGSVGGWVGGTGIQAATHTSNPPPPATHTLTPPPPAIHTRTLPLLKYKPPLRLLAYSTPNPPALHSPQPFPLCGTSHHHHPHHHHQHQRTLLSTPLQYTAHLAGAARAEPGKAVVGAVVPLETPFRLDVTLLGPPRTHTLLQAPVLAAEAQPTSASELGRQMQVGGGWVAG